jgi:hypothetical protein
MKRRIAFAVAAVTLIVVMSMPSIGSAACPYDPQCLSSPYGAGNPYKADGLMNPYSPYDSPYSNKSWTNPYATDAPRLYDGAGNYPGRLSADTFAPDSISNPFGPYGNPYSPSSPNNPFSGTGPLFVVPSR